MRGAAVREIHNCPLPNMVVRIDEQTETEGTWPFRRTYVVKYNIYEHREVLWICDCGGEWLWQGLPGGVKSHWRCKVNPASNWKPYDTESHSVKES